MTLISRTDKIFVAGHKGMVGSAIIRNLELNGYQNLLVEDRVWCNLEDKESVDQFFYKNKPDVVILAAAKVGGIFANSNYPADFLQANLNIQVNVISSAFANDVKRLCFLGSSCIYPKNAPQPIVEESLLSSDLEPTNEFYAIAKIAGLKLCEAYAKQHGFDAFSIMPCNLYGQNDNYHPMNSHVMASLIRKTIIALNTKSHNIECWGTGRPRREFMHVDDLANAVVFLLESWKPTSLEPNWINVGSGTDIRIAELVDCITKILAFPGEITWNSKMPDGTPQKLLNIDRIKKLGWFPKISLEKGIRQTVNSLDYSSFLKE